MPHEPSSVAARHSARQRREERRRLPVSNRDHFEALFLANLALVESVVRFVCGRHKVGADETEEFASEVKLKLVDRDYEVLARFEARSTLRTYLTVVVQRMYLDYRNHQWGKWRPSAAARRLGPVAVRLETLMARDGLAFPEACRHLTEEERAATTPDMLIEMACQLPVRVRRVRVDPAALDTIATGEQADEIALLTDRRAVAHRVAHALRAALDGLPDQDRLILRLRFLEACSVADIARALHLDAKPLYRRVETLLRQLRKTLLDAGVSEAEAHDLLDDSGMTASVALLAGATSAPVRKWLRPREGVS
jgi:RNA polymerase sigma factor (sigma-70 family)